MNFTCFLTIFKKAKPFFVFYDNAIHSYLVIRIWSDVDIPKTYICQFRIMIYAKQASARNKETSQWMIVTLIVLASPSGIFTTILPRQPSSRYWK